MTRNTTLGQPASIASSLLSLKFICYQDGGHPGHKKFAWSPLLLEAVFIVLFGVFGKYHDEADAAVWGNATGQLKKSEINAVNSIVQNYPTPVLAPLVLKAPWWPKRALVLKPLVPLCCPGAGALVLAPLVLLAAPGAKAWCCAPGAGAPGAKAPGAKAPGAKAPGAKALVLKPLVLAPGAKAPGAKALVLKPLMLSADFACATVLISFGALLGRISALQCLALAMIEIPIFAVDMGGAACLCHIFGAYFGIAASRTMAKKADGDNCNDGSRYHNDLFAMIGTIFLWLYWPSFNAGLAVGDDKHRAVINTYLSLAACTLVAFAVSSLFLKGKLEMVHIQNATLAGGVAVGTVSDMMIKPYGAVIIGSLAGVLSVFGYAFLAKRLRANNFLDTCGSLPDLSGPGAEDGQRQFHFHSERRRTGDCRRRRKNGRHAGRLSGRRRSMTLLCAIMGGLLTGEQPGRGHYPCASYSAFHSLTNVPTADFFLDNPVWNVPEDYDGKAAPAEASGRQSGFGRCRAASALIATGDGKQRDEAEEGV
uniref:Ammonium_transp domain-containing protein n=1 Tax=Macrostomum lignano TaxID=282301 RepID=A0A1I8JQQ1_9PLAT